MNECKLKVELLHHKTQKKKKKKKKKDRAPVFYFNNFARKFLRKARLLKIIARILRARARLLKKNKKKNKKKKKKKKKNKKKKTRLLKKIKRNTCKLYVHTYTIQNTLIFNPALASPMARYIDLDGHAYPLMEGIKYVFALM
jgi:hypothetical protein